MQDNRTHNDFLFVRIPIHGGVCNIYVYKYITTLIIIIIIVAESSIACNRPKRFRGYTHTHQRYISYTSYRSRSLQKLRSNGRRHDNIAFHIVHYRPRRLFFDNIIIAMCSVRCRVCAAYEK